MFVQKGLENPMNIGLLISKINNSLRNEGVKGTLQRIFTSIHNEKRADAFDTKYGTDTAGTSPLMMLVAGKRAP